MNILVVDDSAAMRNMIIRTLRQAGFDGNEVTQAEDGAVALAAVKQSLPDLVLADWNMPNMDGLSFVREIRRQGNTTPVIMVTTEAEKERVVEAIRSGVNNYVVKPFTPDALSDRISETMAKAA